MPYLETEPAAQRLSLSPRTLEKWRMTGRGPTFMKLGRRVLYSETDLTAFAESRRRTSTSEAAR